MKLNYFNILFDRSSDADVSRLFARGSVDTGLRLARFFGMNDRFWVGLQTDYDTVREKEVLSEVLSRIQPIQAHAH